MISFIVIVLLAYLLGSIPTAVWIGKFVKGVDIREHGSGNAGATNTFRMLGWKAGTMVLLIDFSKGFVAAYFISQIGFAIGEMPETVGGWNLEVFMRIIAGTSAVLGHMFPLYAGFNGGKGVITAAGMLYGIEPVSISLALGLFVIVLLVSRFVSLASIVASFSYPVFLLIIRYFFQNEDIDGSLMVFSSVVALTIIFQHRGNIKRLLNGTESRIKSFAPAKGKLNEEQVS